ncbi:MAG TPA: hypothetical protein VNG12_19120 [Acidimicrobiales bacterium]|nr:hypothetical protein [Acidimicrobiales bacterium]
MRIRTDVAALPKLFDYAVPDSWLDEVIVGTRVRAVLHGRRVGGWVVQDDVTPPPGVTPQPLTKWSGWGPPPRVVELADWAAWRWAGPASFFLKVASPPQLVRSLPTPPSRSATEASFPPPTDEDQNENEIDRLAAAAGGDARASLLRLPPATDLLDVVLAAVREAATRTGGVLVLVPSLGWAERLTGRLTRRGYWATTDWAEARAGWPIVVGSRATAWAPLPQLAAAVVLDAHDESYREESAPTYNAVDVVLERAHRDEVPCIMTSPVPPVTRSAGAVVKDLTRPLEREGWATLEVVNRRGADPRTGLFSEEFVRLARTVLDTMSPSQPPVPLVCIYNRTGGARLLACASCGVVAQCERCGAAVRKVGERLLCPRCGQERPLVCAACGRLRMKTLRAGVTRLREEVSALLGVDVAEVSGANTAGEEEGRAPVLIGTEAVLHRVRRAAAVAFLDIDLHLLAPRFSASDETLVLLARASRLVGARRAGPTWARVLVQTRVSEHPLLTAVARGEPADFIAGEEEMRRAAGLPPFSALAVLSGPQADGYAADVERDGVPNGVTVSALPDGRHLVKAADHAALCDLLASVPRPAGRGLRVEVDPWAV